MIAGMTWYSSNAADIASFALLALAFLGVAVSFVRNFENRRPEQWAFATGFILLAALAWHANKTDREAFEKRLTGSENYAFFHSRNGQKQSGKFLLYIQGKGDSPDVRICRYRLADDGRKYDEICPPPTYIREVNGEVDWPISAGRWQFDFFALYNNRWSQILNLEEKDGVLTQSIEVRRPGEKDCVYCPPPKILKVIEGP